MREFLIRRTDGEWFDLHRDDFAGTLRPSSFPSHKVEGWGDHRISVEGVEISFSYEDPGVQVSFEGELPVEKCETIVNEILANIEEVTGQKGRIVDI